MKKVILAIIVIGVVIAAGVYVYYNQPEKPDVRTDLLQQTFTNAPADLKAQVDQAIQAIHAKDYQKALSILEEVQYNPDLTDEQMAAAMSMVEELQKAVGKTSEEEEGTAAEEATESTQEEKAEQAATQAVEKAGQTAQQVKQQATQAVEQIKTQAVEQIKTQAVKEVQKAVEGAKKKAVQKAQEASQAVKKATGAGAALLQKGATNVLQK